MSRAAVFSKFGRPEEVVEVHHVDQQALEPGEVRLQMLASAINPADINFVEGRYGVRPDLPCRPGMEGCGEVVETASDELAVGQKVIFLRRGGSWAEEVVAPAAELIAVPAEMDPLQGAMLGVNPLTAYVMLREFAELERGDVVLQNAANSNVGRCVIQLAKLWGYRTVSTVRRPELIAELQELGGDHVALDDRSLKGLFAEMAAPKLALNCVGGESGQLQLKLLAERGVQVTFGAMSKEAIVLPNGPLIFKELELRGFWVTKWRAAQSREVVTDAYAALAQAVVSGDLTQAVEQVYPLDDLQKALAHAQQPERGGKVLLKF